MCGMATDDCIGFVHMLKREEATPTLTVQSMVGLSICFPQFSRKGASLHASVKLAFNFQFSVITTIPIR